jgi:tetratricopeptide (TPR) repeat protein
VAVYLNSLTGGFVFDDLPAIVENPTIRSFTPPWQPLVPPPGGSSVVGRPIINLSFAINHAISGLDVRGFHVVNLLIHLAAGLTLFGIVRRTLALPWAPGWLRSSAVPLGFCAALLWSVHPLQTESVTFIVQRTESLGGLVYLLALYGFVRATTTSSPHERAEKPEPEVATVAPTAIDQMALGTSAATFDPNLDPARKRVWFALSIAACFVGVATKEILATAPLILLFYDRAFIAGSFGAAWRERRWFYTTAAASWLLLAFFMSQAEGRGGTVALGRGVSVWTTLLTQCEAISMYLKLSLWPHPLIVDYGDYGSDAVRSLKAVWPQALGLVVLGGFTIFALIKYPAIGFLGAWFFIILGPSSSFIPLLSQARAEHRMYLPLAAVIAGATVGLWRLTGRGAIGVVAVLAIALGSVTVARNRDYRSELTLWTATADARPQNPRAHYNLGLELVKIGDATGAIRAYEESLRLHPERTSARVNLATLLLTSNRVADARVHAEIAVKLEPTAPRARNIFGRVLFEEGRAGAAISEFKEALRLDPDSAESHTNLGIALAAERSMTEAVKHLQRSAMLEPSAGTFVTLGKMYREMNQMTEARQSFEAAVRLESDHAMAHFQLGDLLAMSGDHAGAVRHYEVAVRGMPTTIPPHYNLGMALRALGRSAEAIECFQHVLRLDPKDVGAREILQSLR